MTTLKHNFFGQSLDLIDLVCAVMQTDAYKLSHKGFMDEGTEVIVSNGTPRSDKHCPLPPSMKTGKAVWVGLQKFLIDFFIVEWNRTFFDRSWEEVEVELSLYLGSFIGMDDFEHFKALHELGYLPLEVRSLPEGSFVPMRVPAYVMYNTDDRFPWVTNFEETVMSCEVWKPMTIATIIQAYRKLGNEYAYITLGEEAMNAFPMFSGAHPTDWQFHGFEFRGMSGRHDAATCSTAFLMSSLGTDTVPALSSLVKYYGAKIGKELLASSVPASEHAISCLGTAIKGELESYRKWMTVDYPTGIVSLVSDTFDYFKVLTEFLPLLKDDILARKPNAIGLAKVVIRPDSGNPADIICGTALPWHHIADIIEKDPEHVINLLSLKTSKGLVVRSADGVYFGLNTEDKLIRVVATPEERGSIEILWDLFGGTISATGYRIIHERIGLIYGDSITPKLAEEIFQRLAYKGYASTNVVLGIGSYTSQYVTRDTYGFAVKATAAKFNGEWYELFKDPKTDDGTKKSAKGLVYVYKDEHGDYAYRDQVSWEEFLSEGNELKPVFRNGQMLKLQTMTEIRNRIWGL